MSPASQGEMVNNNRESNRESDCEPKPARFLQDFPLFVFVPRARMASRLKLTSVSASALSIGYKLAILVINEPETEQFARLPDDFISHHIEPNHIHRLSAAGGTMH